MEFGGPAPHLPEGLPELQNVQSPGYQLRLRRGGEALKV
jgi:hypothetical protein